MTLTQLQIFASIIETGSFTRTSEVVGLTQPAVSHALAGLEAELGVPLVHRTRTGPVLTKAAEKILPQVREILACSEAIRQEASAAKGKKTTGTLKLGSFPSASTRFLPSVLKDFQERYPKINITLFEGTDEEVKSWIESHVVDVGVVTLPAEGLDTTPIGSDEWLVVMPEGHRLSNQDSVTLKQVAAESLLMSKGGCEPLIVGLFANARLKPQIRFGVKEISTLLAMVSEGLGISIVPEWSLPSELSGIKALPLSPRAYRQLGLAIPSAELASRATKLFLEQSKAAP